jgi:thymidylate synthase (FAD)
MKSVPQQVTLVDHMGSDLSVVNAARVSFDKVSDSVELADEKLIGYLATHNHWSPFAHAFVSFRIKAPVFVARQLVKHQVGLAWNEVSRRYVDSEPEFYFPTHLRGKAANVKQGSTDAPHELSGPFLVHLRNETKVSLRLYTAMVSDGVCAEQARMILPLNTMTEWIWSGSLMAFARVANLRLDSHTQRETQEVAQMIHTHMQSLYPAAWAALVKEPQ